MSQADDLELRRVQPDAPPAQPSDEDRHSRLGSFAPLAPQRPAPIIKLAGTILLQFLLNLVLYDLLALASAPVRLGASAVLALALAAYAYAGWLGQAATGWKIATFAALALNALSVASFGLARLA